MLFAWQAQGFGGQRLRCLKSRTLNPWKGCKFHVTDMLLSRDHFAWQLQEFVCLGSTFFVAGAVLLKRPLQNRYNVLEF